MSGNELTRRRAVGLAAGAAIGLARGGRWVFAAHQGEVVKAAGEPGAWQPVLFDARQAEAMARLVDALIPRTSTPGARDARVHEYIDLALSLGPANEKTSFLEGLRWLDRHCKERYGADLVSVKDADLVELLHSVSDEHEEHPEALRHGAELFSSLKRRTIFGYYTSLEGRVQELGLPEVVSMEGWRGCGHDGSDHTS
jgi:hypothetical protein